MKIALSKRQSAVLDILSKPKIPAELREQIGLKKNNNLSSTIKQLEDLNLIYCLNPKARVGKLYGLTLRGKKYRKTLRYGNGITDDYVEAIGLNWNLYGWVISGKQRKAILKALKVPMPVEYIRKRAQEYNPRINFRNAFDILQLFLKWRIVRKDKIASRAFSHLINMRLSKFIYTLTKAGQAIRNQLLEP